MHLPTLHALKTGGILTIYVASSKSAASTHDWQRTEETYILLLQGSTMGRIMIQTFREISFHSGSGSSTFNTLFSSTHRGNPHNLPLAPNTPQTKHIRATIRSQLGQNKA